MEIMAGAQGEAEKLLHVAGRGGLEVDRGSLALSLASSPSLDSLSPTLIPCSPEALGWGSDRDWVEATTWDDQVGAEIPCPGPEQVLYGKGAPCREGSWED